MSRTQAIIALVAFFTVLTARAQTPEVNKPLPSLIIEDRGEVHLEGDDTAYQPWNSNANPGSVHILQYFAGTRSASATFSDFTDIIGDTYSKPDIHITTVINLDEALWGTGGLVVSEAEASKREFPNSTMVLDEEGTGRSGWELEKKGAALTVMDRQGKILFFTQEALSESQLQDLLQLVKTQIEGERILSE